MYTHMSRYEFDESDHPLRVACYALPSFDGETAEVDIIVDEDERIRVSGVPESNIERLRMPRLSSEIPAFVRQPLEKGIGIGIVACRMLSQEDDSVTLELPTVPDATIVTVPASRLARVR
jgi:hypothetical protein